MVLCSCTGVRSFWLLGIGEQCIAEDDASVSGRRFVPIKDHYIVSWKFHNPLRSIVVRKDLESVMWSATMMSGATLFNLSLLTSDMWAVIICIFLLSSIVKLYFTSRNVSETIQMPQCHASRKALSFYHILELDSASSIIYKPLSNILQNVPINTSENNMANGTVNGDESESLRYERLIEESSATCNGVLVT
ncbi:hypothetical protein OPV22_020809 [Ensete ventricosum]|uniref:Reticulon-like protein n=1 Tax=Ensete ventricosum TaxID=4639 RepID=A0AAV8QP59_ENSVE|nr:hypothetical protein OPV22_020809 [Ensete ventricosum]